MNQIPEEAVLRNSYEVNQTGAKLSCEIRAPINIATKRRNHETCPDLVSPQHYKRISTLKSDKDELMNNLTIQNTKDLVCSIKILEELDSRNDGAQMIEMLLSGECTKEAILMAISSHLESQALPNFKGQLDGFFSIILTNTIGLIATLGSLASHFLKEQGDDGVLPFAVLLRGVVILCYESCQLIKVRC